MFYAAVEFCPANSWWDDFAALNKYVERCQSFLQAGKPDNDLLVYAPIFDDWMVPGNGAMPHYSVERRWPGQEVGRQLLKAGYTFDFMSDRLLKNVTFADGKLHCGGNEYQAIVLPEAKFIPLETMEKLAGLVKQGATLVVQKSLPTDVPGWQDMENRRAKFQSLAKEWKDKQPASLRMGDDLPTLLTAAGVRREKLADAKIQFVRRRIGDSTVYFLLNTSGKTIEPTEFIARGRAPFSSRGNL